MKISIITTTYNAEKYLEETIESILSQRGDFKIEYIIIDAKSTDSTLEKINKYKKLVERDFYTGRNQGIEFIVFSEADHGMYEGITKGLKIATGDVIAYLNADDFYLPNSFSTVADIFSTFNDVNWITSKMNTFNHKGQPIWQQNPYRYSNFLLKKGAYGTILNFIEQENIFYRRQLLDKIDLEKFKQYKLAGDFYLWKKFSETEELYIVDTIFGGFRFSPNQKSENKDAYFKEYYEILKYTPNIFDKILFKLEKIFIKKYYYYLTRINKKIIRYELKTEKWEFGERKKCFFEKLLKK